MSEKDKANSVDLEFVGTDDLLDELARRHSSMIFGGIPLINSAVISMRITGQTTTCIGLATATKRASLNAMNLKPK
jgi:hypothetical protein